MTKEYFSMGVMKKRLNVSSAKQRIMGICHHWDAVMETIAVLTTNPAITGPGIQLNTTCQNTCTGLANDTQQTNDNFCNFAVLRPINFAYFGVLVQSVLVCD